MLNLATLGFTNLKDKPKVTQKFESRSYPKNTKRRKSRTKPEQAEVLKDFIESDLGVAEFEETRGYSAATVWNYRKSLIHNKDFKEIAKEADKKIKERAQAEIAEKRRLAEIFILDKVRLGGVIATAKAHNISSHKVYKLIKSYRDGVYGTPSREILNKEKALLAKYRKELTDKIKADWLGGMSARDIQAKHGVYHKLLGELISDGFLPARKRGVYFYIDNSK